MCVCVCVCVPVPVPVPVPVCVCVCGHVCVDVYLYLSGCLQVNMFFFLLYFGLYFVVMYRYVWWLDMVM